MRPRNAARSGCSSTSALCVSWPPSQKIIGKLRDFPTSLFTRRKRFVPAHARANSEPKHAPLDTARRQSVAMNKNAIFQKRCRKATKMLRRYDCPSGLCIWSGHGRDGRYPRTCNTSGYRRRPFRLASGRFWDIIGPCLLIATLCTRQHLAAVRSSF
jgi:hypothetical protein